MKGDNIPFHIYELTICVFNQTSRADLRNITTLIVTRWLTIDSDCQIILPALRKLTLGTLGMNFGARMEAPLLDHLHISRYCSPGFYPRITPPFHTGGAILHPGYLLSPNTSIAIGAHFHIVTLIKTLVSSPKVTHATLQFYDWEQALVVLERLFGFGPDVNPQSVGVEGLCPRLSELRLDFHWEFSEPSASKDWLLDALKARKNVDFMEPLSIFVSWKGEGRYVLPKGG
jgi:hypothetical protein